MSNPGREANMKYNVTLEATVEAPNAEAAEKQMMIDKASQNTGDVTIEAVPTKEWTVAANISTTYSLYLTVNAESAEDAEQNAHELVSDEISYGNGISGALELDSSYDYDLESVHIEVYDPKPVEDDDDQTVKAAHATA